MIGDQPAGGVITFDAVQVKDATMLPRVWLHRFPYGTFELDLDYPAYLEALLLTKGFYGWQFLYADVPLGSVDYVSIAPMIRHGIDILHDHLPDPRLDNLEARFAERLG